VSLDEGIGLASLRVRIRPDGIPRGIESRIFDVAGDLNVFAARTLDVPSCYIAGAREWGVYQTPGAFEAMQRGACTKLLGVHLVKGAGHSVAEERPEEVNRLLVEFLQRAKAAI
jgi:pimeloyl-ACP methyl ester carboxylesterase